MNASPINECNRIPGDGVTYAVARMVFPAVLNANARNYTNTRHWTQWARHFGLPSRLNPPIRDAIRRYVLTAFAYGCGLGVPPKLRGTSTGRFPPINWRSSIGATWISPIGE
jgi:hypothetical protein